MIGLARTPLIITGFLALCSPLPADSPSKRPAPGVITLDALESLEALSPKRQKLVKTALQTAKRFNFNQYLYGSADPSKGGFDCSGSMYYLLREVDIQPPRTSSAQYEWIKKAGTLTTVPPKTASLDDPVFEKLKPGDLIFWAGTYKPTDGRKNGVTHVQMYLGRESKDGLRIMIGSSDGRSYRGTARCGFGIFDLRLPRKTSKSRLVGFGPPPGLEPAVEEESP
jgi:hypothetical protein